MIRFRYRFAGRTERFGFGLNVAQESLLRERGIEDDTLAEAVTVDSTGITLTLTDGRTFAFCPNDWAGWWQGREPVEGEAACRAWSQWLEHMFQHNARVMLAKIEAGELTWLDAREERPELFDHPRVQAALAAAFVSDTHQHRRRGKRANISEATWQLYEWASLYYLRGIEGSWEMACERACEDHPDLVPVTWTTDPGGNLKRRASRQLDRDYKRGQPRRRAQDR